MLQKNSILAMALCAGLTGSLAFGADAPTQEQPFTPDAPTQDTSFTEDVSYCVERVRPYITPQNGIAVGGSLFGFGLAVKAVQYAIVPAVKEGMSVQDVMNAINARTSSAMKVGLFGGFCAAGLASYALIKESLKPREEGDSENKRKYQFMVGTGLGLGCLALGARLLGYGVAKLS